MQKSRFIGPTPGAEASRWLSALPRCLSDVSTCGTDCGSSRTEDGWFKDERGYDPARRVVGRKRHALTDTDGRLLLATVSTADRHDSHGGVALLRASRRLWPFLAHCFADRAYQGERVGNATAIGASSEKLGERVEQLELAIEALETDAAERLCAAPVVTEVIETARLRPARRALTCTASRPTPAPASGRPARRRWRRR